MIPKGFQNDPKVIPTDFREKNVSFTICRRAKVLECVSILVNRRDDTAAALEIHVSGEHQLSKWPHSHIAMEPHSYIATQPQSHIAT